MRLCLIAAAIACLSAACTPAPTGSSANQAPATAPGASAALQSMDANLLRAAARKALVEQRIYSPANDNAIEYYLALHGRDGQDEATNVALAELQPYAVIAAEQSQQRDDLGDAQRLITLIAAMDPQASALPRLRDEQLRREKMHVLAQEKARAAATAVIANATPPVVAASAATAVTAPAPRAVVAAPAPASPVAVAVAVATPVPVPSEAPAPTAPKPVPVATSSRTPVLVHDATPRYPSLALRRGIEGEVELSFTISPDGSVSDSRVLRATPAGMFEEAAIAATRFWKFEATGQATAGHRVVAFNLPKRTP